MAVKAVVDGRRPELSGLLSGQVVIALLFLVALLAFELFNFDTTRFALSDLLGGASFVTVRWATILALAFCAIDFAGLLRFFLPGDAGAGAPVELWYLMGAWLLGATMNALMTWWAVSLTLLDHELGNEILSRQQLLEVVPVFVAVLVWLTRILFIGACTVAGGYLFDSTGRQTGAGSEPQKERQEKGRAAVGLRKGRAPATLRRNRHGRRRRSARPAAPAGLHHVTDEIPSFLRKPARAEEENGGPRIQEKVSQ